MVRDFPKSRNQLNEMALTICNSISLHCFRLMRDWKLESFANGKKFPTEKEEHNFRMEFPENYLTKFDFKSKFPVFLAKW